MGRQIKLTTFLATALSFGFAMGCTVPYEDVDTDGDGQLDFVDADDDNDGFLDLVEYRCESYGGDAKDATDMPEAPEASETDEDAVACRNALSALIRCDTVRSPDGKAQGESCTVPGKTGSCAEGTWICQESNPPVLVCTPNLAGQVEFCDGLDNDCNDRVDDIAETQCGTGLPGICGVGVRKCVGTGAQVTEQCQGTQPGTVTEICDGQDNDCNGPTDDGIQGVGEDCDTGMGGSCSVGTLVCSGAQGQSCQPKSVGEEVCDGLDNDCSGTADDHIAQVGTFCTTEGLGECGKGVWECAGSPQPSLRCRENVASAEICNNGLDEDCSGTPDDGTNCGCTDRDNDGYGTGGGCLGPDCDDNNRDVHPNASDANCDGVDDDCVGGADQNFETGSCTAEAMGTCAQGRLVCSSGGVSCLPGQPGSEVCNGSDDDCDGVPDFQPGEVTDPAIGMACASNAPGVCGPGTLVCTEGNPPVVCRSNIQPGTNVEVCDGLDNDCNGRSDETFSPSCEGQTWGEQCNSGNLTCSRGLSCTSLGIGETEGTCLKICTTLADCLSGQSCQPVGGQRICISLCDPSSPSPCPSGQICTQDGFCAPQPCGSGLPACAAGTCRPQGYCAP